MRNVLAKSAFSLALAGTLAFTGFNLMDKEVETTGQSHLSVMEPISATPELAEFAKEKGIDLSEHEAVQKILNAKGNKFQEPGDNHVTYKDTGEDVPMLVFLAKFKDDSAPLGASSTPVPAEQFQDLIFGDTYNPYELEQFKQYAVSPDGIEAPTDRTMQNIYSENSYGKVKLTAATDLAWVELPETAEYYLGQDNGDFDNEHGYAHMGELVSHLIKEVDGDIDFSKYAVETEEGKVLPNVFIVHAGTGAEWSRDPAQIWSHKWDVPSALFWGEFYKTGSLEFADLNKDGNVDLEEEGKWMEENKHKWTTDEGVAVGTYGIQPEIGGNVTGYNSATGKYDGVKTGPYPAQPGVFAHEFGHVLGLPDFYDTDYSSVGVGNFSMMAGGSWLSYPASSSAYSGNTPSGFDPFSKIFLGWADPIVVEPGTSKEITLKPVNEANSNEAFVKMEVPGSNGTEYFLFENIQQTGFNQGYSKVGENAHGLVAWHVDENIISLYQTAGQRVNNVENWMNKKFQANQTKTVVDGEGNPVDITHYGLSVLQADGNHDLERYVNRGDEGDFFKTGDKFTPNSSNVHSGSYYFWKGNGSTPADSGIHVTDIVENEDGSITAKFYYATNEGKASGKKN